MLRPYLPTDRPTCLAVFDSNLPRFFAESERADFATFLDKVEAEPEPYFVLERDSVVACGVGYEDSSALICLSWLRQHRPEVTHED